MFVLQGPCEGSRQYLLGSGIHGHSRKGSLWLLFLTLLDMHWAALILHYCVLGKNSKQSVFEFFFIFAAYSCFLYILISESHFMPN